MGFIIDVATRGGIEMIKITPPNSNTNGSQYYKKEINEKITPLQKKIKFQRCLWASFIVRRNSSDKEEVGKSFLLTKVKSAI